nr:MAG TPA: hypothetical protein [Caudoviricetes sp.]
MSNHLFTLGFPILFRGLDYIFNYFKMSNISGCALTQT